MTVYDKRRNHSISTKLDNFWLFYINLYEFLFFHFVFNLLPNFHFCQQIVLCPILHLKCMKDICSDQQIVEIKKNCTWIRVFNRWCWITFGQMYSFSSSCSGDTDRWHINEGLCATCQCPLCPHLERRCICPKVIQLHPLRTL